MGKMLSIAAFVFGATLLVAGCGGGGGDDSGKTSPDPTVRAYGRVNAAGVLSRSKGVSEVRPSGAGAYCIALAGDADTSETGLVATPDTAAGANAGEVLVEWRSEGVGSVCPEGQLEIRTARWRDGAFVPGAAGFFFVVP